MCLSSELPISSLQPGRMGPSLRWQDLEGLCYLFLPWQPGLAVDFSLDTNLGKAAEKTSTEDDGFAAKRSLLVVRVGCAGWAVVTVDWLA